MLVLSTLAIYLGILIHCIVYIGRQAKFDVIRMVRQAKFDAIRMVLPAWERALVFYPANLLLILS